jgi:hypothetical protein
LAFAAALALGACAFGNGKLTGQDTSYAVTSNGGQAVQYGDYVYFVNGTVPGFTDDDGSANKWGEVEKGGVYRVKLEGGAPKTYAYDEKHTSDFGVPAVGRTERYPDLPDASLTVYEQNLNGFPELNNFPVKTRTGASFTEGEPDAAFIDPDSVQRVVPKVVSFSGDSSAGIFIYGDFIYYATYSNRRSKTGSVEYTLTEFYRTGVDGQKTKLLYASSEAVTQYNFYYRGGTVYLVLREGSKLKSVSIDRRGRMKTNALEDDVTEVFFPRKSVYYAGVNENTLSDFVFYTRALTKEDKATAGNALEMRRPDLDELEYGCLEADETTYSVAGVSDNTLFYYATPSFGGSKDVKSLMAKDYTQLISGAVEKSEYLPARTLIADAGSAAQVQVFTGGSNVATGRSPAALGVADGKLTRYLDGASHSVCDMSGTILGVYNNTVYFHESNALYSVETYADSDTGLFTAGEKVKISDKAISTDNNFGLDVAGGLLFFLSSATLEQKDFTFEINESVANYMYCKAQYKAQALDDEYLVGVIAVSDQPEEDEE